MTLDQVKMRRQQSENIFLGWNRCQVFIGAVFFCPVLMLKDTL